MIDEEIILLHVVLLRRTLMLLRGTVLLWRAPIVLRGFLQNGCASNPGQIAPPIPAKLHLQFRRIVDMSCINITGSQLACFPSTFPAQAVRLNRASAYSFKLGTKFPKTPLKLKYATSQHQQASPVCLFGGKGNSNNGNKQVIGSVKEKQSVEGLPKQQILEEENYDDGGTGGEPPGDGGESGGSGPGEDESPEDRREDFRQTLMVAIGFIFLYIYIVEAEDINVYVKDVFKYAFTRKMSFRLGRLVKKWKMFFEGETEEEEEDYPYLLENEMVDTPNHV